MFALNVREVQEKGAMELTKHGWPLLTSLRAIVNI